MLSAQQPGGEGMVRFVKVCPVSRMVLSTSECREQMKPDSPFKRSSMSAASLGCFLLNPP